MTTGIIAEYNPFHNGHKYMLKQIREQFPQEPIIICLSGSITQRGVPKPLAREELHY